MMCLLFLSENICKCNHTGSCWNKRPGYPTFLFFMYRIQQILISILFHYFIHFFHYDFGIFNNLAILLLSSISEHIHLSCLIRTNILSFYSWTSIGLHIRRQNINNLTVCSKIVQHCKIYELSRIIKCYACHANAPPVWKTPFYLQIILFVRLLGGEDEYHPR